MKLSLLYHIREHLDLNLKKKKTNKKYTHTQTKQTNKITKSLCIALTPPGYKSSVLEMQRELPLSLCDVSGVESQLILLALR